MKSRTASIPILIFTAAELVEMADGSAGTTNATMGVTAHVVSQCTVDAGAMSFPQYDSIAGHHLDEPGVAGRGSAAGGQRGVIDGQATLKVTCSKGAAASITLGQGVDPGATSTDLAPARRMTSADGHALGYGLYQDAERLVPWGNAQPTAGSYVAASNAPTELTVYGRIASHQDVPAGDYADSIIATINF